MLGPQAVMPVWPRTGSPRSVSNSLVRKHFFFHQAGLLTHGSSYSPGLPISLSQNSGFPGFRPRSQRRDRSRFARDSLLNKCVPEGLLWSLSYFPFFCLSTANNRQRRRSGGPAYLQKEAVQRRRGSGAVPFFRQPRPQKEPCRRPSRKGLRRSVRGR